MRGTESVNVQWSYPLAEPGEPSGHEAGVKPSATSIVPLPWRLNGLLFVVSTFATS